MLFAFDCDGVLVDSEIIASQVDAELFTRNGYEITAKEVSRRFAGLTSRAIHDIVEKETGRPLPESYMQEQNAELDRRLARNLKAVPGVSEMLERLEGRPYCICSNSTSERLRIELEKTRLWDSFAPNIFSAVEVGDRRPKPAPNVYSYAAAKMGFAPRDVLVLEDSVFGVHAAKAAGCRVIGFTGGSHTWPGHTDLLTDAGAETVIRSFADLPRIAEAVMSWEGME